MKHKKVICTISHAIYHTKCIIEHAILAKSSKNVEGRLFQIEIVSNRTCLVI